MKRQHGKTLAIHVALSLPLPWGISQRYLMPLQFGFPLLGSWPL
jgi:hypothetical protein